MDVRKIKVVLLFIILLQGCSYYRTMEMSAVLSPGQQTGYKETITSQKKHFVSLAPYREENPAKGNTSFILFVINCSEESMDISIQNVTAVFTGNTQKWESRNIPVLSRDELIGQLSDNTIFYKENKYIYIGDSGGQMGFSYDPYTGSQLPFPSNGSGGSWVSDNSYLRSAQKNRVMALVLQPQVLQPGEDCSGLVVLDTREMNYKVEGKFHVIVSVDNEQHEFVFSRKLSE